jgi:hypothetical protein
MLKSACIAFKNQFYIEKQAFGKIKLKRYSRQDSRSKQTLIQRAQMKNKISI